MAMTGFCRAYWRKAFRTRLDSSIRSLKREYEVA